MVRWKAFDVMVFFVGLKTSDAEPAAPCGALVARYMAPSRTGRQRTVAPVREASASMLRVV